MVNGSMGYNLNIHHLQVGEITPLIRSPLNRSRNCPWTSGSTFLSSPTSISRLGDCLRRAPSNFERWTDGQGPRKTAGCLVGGLNPLEKY